MSANFENNYKPVLTIFFILIFFFENPLESFPSQIDPAMQWHHLYIQIRDGSISKEDAQPLMRSLENLLKEFYFKKWDRREKEPLCFPLEGYGASAIGGKGGDGYQAKGYDFFDGNRHKGHPGHDIFIRDKDQDGIDDSTGKPVNVIAASSGIVVSVHLGWTPSSPIRGGNSIWIYEPVESRYYYYAHLNNIFVKIGHFVSRGELIGTVGRTGKNAYERRSPTHLHFTIHQSADRHLMPINPYKDLAKSRL